jgi:hypothetical protein
MLHVGGFDRWFGELKDFDVELIQSGGIRKSKHAEN